MLPTKATVREAVAFAANLKFPTRMSFGEREAAIDRALHLLRLTDVANVIIGVPELGEYACMCFAVRPYFCSLPHLQWSVERGQQASRHCNGDCVHAACALP